MMRTVTADLDNLKDGFAVRLRAAMSFRGETQSSFAQKINVKRQTISAYCNGLSQPTVDVLRKIAESLEVSADWLIGLSHDPVIRPEYEDYLTIGAAAALTVERAWNSSERADFVSFLLEHPAFDKLIEAVAAVKAESREEHLLEIGDFVFDDEAEKAVREAANKALVDHYAKQILSDLLKREE